MRNLINWVKAKINLAVHSWAFAFLLGMIIGIAYFFCYAEGKALYKELFSVSTIYIARAETNSVSGQNQAQSGNLVPRQLGDGNPEWVYSDLVKKYFGDEWKIAYAIMRCESQGEASRVGDTHLPKPSIGLFQINQIWHPYTAEQLRDPEFNIKTAKEIRNSGGFERWTCYKTGGYEKYLIN